MQCFRGERILGQSLHSSGRQTYWISSLSLFHPLQNVTGTFEWIWFWRESTKDALYSFGNVQLRPANLSNARYVGSQPNLEIRWAISEHFLAALNVAGFITGKFLQQSPPSQQIVFFNGGL